MRPRLSRFRAGTPRIAGGAVRPFLPPVPQYMPPVGWAEWLADIARTLNVAIAGNINVLRDVALDTGTSTIVTDDRIGLWSAVLAAPLSATAAAAMPAIWFEVGSGQVTLHHVADAATDRNLRLVIFG